MSVATSAPTGPRTRRQRRAAPALRSAPRMAGQTLWILAWTSGAVSPSSSHESTDWMRSLMA
eukprot:8942324-Pyramimonas_sp.AAC.1